MSDRLREDLQYVEDNWDEINDPEGRVAAAVRGFLDDPVAVVRRGVESGTIEGAVRNESYCDTCGAVTIKREYHTHGRLLTRWYLRIPVSNSEEQR